MRFFSFQDNIWHSLYFFYVMTYINISFFTVSFLFFSVFFLCREFLFYGFFYSLIHNISSFCTPSYSLILFLISHLSDTSLNTFLRSFRDHPFSLLFSSLLFSLLCLFFISFTFFYFLSSLISFYLFLNFPTLQFIKHILNRIFQILFRSKQAWAA